MSTTAPKVLVSYFAESAEHHDQVRAFARLLRAHGVDARMDVWAGAVRLDRPRWFAEQAGVVDRVVVVASPTYRRVGDGHAGGETTAHLAGDVALLADLVHGDRGRWLTAIVPVVLPGGSAVDVPAFLRAGTVGAIAVPELSAQGIRGLLRELTAQPEFVAPALGAAGRVDEHPAAVVLTTEVSVHRALGEHRLDTSDVRGTLFDLVRPGSSAFWLAQLADGGQAAAHVERVAARFGPLPLLLVGMATARAVPRAVGVVVADHAYGYEEIDSGDDGDRARIKTAAPAHRLLQRALALARADSRITVGPVASGAKAVRGERSTAAAWIALHCADAVAVESGAHGFLRAAGAVPGMEALTVHPVVRLPRARPSAAAARAGAGFTIDLIDAVAPR